MKLNRYIGATSQTVYLFIRDSSSTTGAGLTGLAYNTSSLVAYYVRTRGSSTAITLATLAAANSSYSSGGFKEVDSTNLPGVYRFDIPDACLASGADSVVIVLKGAANMVPVGLEIDLDSQVDIRASVGVAAANSDGTATAGGSATITLGTGVSFATNALRGRAITILSGTGAGQSEVIASNTNATPSVVTIQRNWLVVPDNTSVYAIDESRVADSIANVSFPTNFASLVIDSTGRVNAFLIGILTSVFTEGATGRIAAAFKQFFNIASPAATMDHGVLVDTVTTTTTLTNAPSDSAGVTTLLARLTSARAGYLDNLNVGGAVASQADINALNQSASRRVILQTVGQYERPESGSTVYTVEIRTYDGDGVPTNADSDPTLTATGQTTGDLSVNVGASTNPSTGVYRRTYTVSSSATVEPVRFDASATISSTVFPMSVYTQVVDLVSATWSTTDQSHLTAIYNKLPSSSYVRGTANSDGSESDKAGYALTSAYDPAKTAAQAGDAMSLTSSERTTLAGVIWAVATSALTTAGSIGKRLVDFVTSLVYSAAPTAAANASAVRTELSTELARIDAATSTRASQTSVDAIDDYIDTEVAAIKAKTDNLPSDPADASDIAALIATVNSTLATIAGYIDTEVAAIKAKTDNLPSDPADASDIAASFASVASTLATIAAYIDTEVASIKSKTDKLTFTSGNDLDVNVQKVNDVALVGDGSTTPWGPA